MKKLGLIGGIGPRCGDGDVETPLSHKLDAGVVWDGGRPKSIMGRVRS